MEGVVQHDEEHSENNEVGGRVADEDGPQEVLRILQVAVEQLRGISAGADVFSRQSDGTTIAAQYAREGIRLRPANMDRVNGWAELRGKLGDPAAGILPKLFVHRRCGRLIETLPALQHDPNRPEDVLKVDADEDGVGGDDAADALRYLVATKAMTIKVIAVNTFKEAVRPGVLVIALLEGKE